MSASLTISVSDEVFARLRNQANLHGTTPEWEAAAEIANRALKSSGDPLMMWAGAVESNAPDAAERHDEYLGSSLHGELSDKSEVK